jgi:uncharacterized protein YcgI (DUF1989 family)
MAETRMRVRIEQKVRIEQLRPHASIAMALAPGDTLTYEDLEGGQSAELVFFALGHLGERFSSPNTLLLNASIFPTTGHRLFSTECRPLMTIVHDSVGHNDVISGGCDPDRSPARLGAYGLGPETSRASLAASVEPWGVPADYVPPPFAIFLRQQVDVSSGALVWGSSPSKPGDSITFRADSELVVAIAHVPQQEPTLALPARVVASPLTSR